MYWPFGEVSFAMGRQREALCHSCFTWQSGADFVEREWEVKFSASLGVWHIRGVLCPQRSGSYAHDAGCVCVMRGVWCGVRGVRCGARDARHVVRGAWYEM